MGGGGVPSSHPSFAFYFFFVSSEVERVVVICLASTHTALGERECPVRAWLFFHLPTTTYLVLKGGDLVRSAGTKVEYV